jgi:hypothetical protein
VPGPVEAGPLEPLSVELEPVGRPRRAGRRASGALVVGAWAAGLIAVVVAAWVGASTAGLDQRSRPAIATGSPRVGPAALQAANSAAPAPPTVPLIVLEHPAADLEVITTRDLVVEGHLDGGTGPVRVALDVGSARPLAVKTVGPMTVPWDDDRDLRPSFAVTLPIPGPRPGGTMVVQVVAYDFAGVPQEVLRRRVRIGSIGAPEWSRDGQRERTRRLGDDGLVGAIHLSPGVARMLGQ